MDNNEYKKRIEELGYMASSELVTAVEELHAKQLTDELIDRAYAEIRRTKNPPLGKPAKKEKATKTEAPPPKKTGEEGGER
jgi:hypothetical protein